MGEEDIFVWILRALRFPKDIDGLERYLDFDRHTIEWALEVLERRGYIRPSKCETTCSVCPIRDSCSFRKSKMWEITRKGMEYLSSRK